jgi:hypothetical protein
LTFQVLMNFGEEECSSVSVEVRIVQKMPCLMTLILGNIFIVSSSFD